ncbi:MAG: hypothetical protein ABIH66_00085 [bacterium]
MSPPKKQKLFDRGRLEVLPLAERRHELGLDAILPLDHKPAAKAPSALPEAASAIRRAREAGAPVALMMGAHVLRRGVVRFLIDLVERGLITHVATNGACPIHDLEFALVGATTESVSRYIEDGRFGLWRETAAINDALNAAMPERKGFGETVGEMISRGDYPHRDISLFAKCHQKDVPITVHVGIGHDIIHEHPNCDGAATGQASYIDFLIFAETIRNFQDGVLLNMGSAVMGPEVFLKALAMARNAARREGRKIDRFTTAVFDIADIPEKFDREPEKNTPEYYLRWWKTLLVRAPAGGGKSFFVKGDLRDTVPLLYHELADPK